MCKEGSGFEVLIVGDFQDTPASMSMPIKPHAGCRVDRRHRVPPVPSDVEALRRWDIVQELTGNVTGSTPAIIKSVARSEAMKYQIANSCYVAILCIMREEFCRTCRRPSASTSASALSGFRFIIAELR